MDREGFRKFLKKMSKNDHVIETLICNVADFESFLASGVKMDIGSAVESEIIGYIDSRLSDTAKKSVRGLALHYKFTGNTPLANLICGFREREITKTRSVLQLKDLPGVKSEVVSKLKVIGIVTVEEMLKAGTTPQKRHGLSKQARISQKDTLELIKLSDLSRLRGVKSIRTRLYYGAGLDTPRKFAEWDPEDLRQMLIKFVESTGFDGIAPLPKELRVTIEMAKSLPDVVEY